MGLFKYKEGVNLDESESFFKHLTNETYIFIPATFNYYIFWTCS
jgi:hypothetical protein